MKIKPLFPVFAACALTMIVAGGCSSPASRIEENQAEFNAYSPVTQALIRDGRVEVGFTPKQVEMALGEADRVYTRTTIAGTSEVWAYRDNSPTFGFGVGVGGSTGGSTRVGSGLGVSTYGDDFGDRMRVVFESGRVIAVEELAK